MTQSRVAAILEYMHVHNLVTVEELQKLTGASASSVRRDLASLSRKGSVIRIHGGATLSRYVPAQPSTEEKAMQRREEKERIGRAAAALLKEGGSVLLDAGTTALEVARSIPDMPLTVYTPDLRVALALSGLSKVRVELSGGTLDRSSQSCVGSRSVECFSSIIPSACFIACNAWSLGYGVMTPSPEKVELKRAMLSGPALKVLVADSSKYGATAMCRICSVQDLDCVVTDAGLPDDAAYEIGRLGVRVIRA
ncbi:MAG: DeoR/GlpR family DNA-binding transcription regulator [Succinivibrio sp.]